MELEQSRLIDARQRVTLSFLPFSAPNLLSEIRRNLFPDISAAVKMFFVDKGPLACVIVDPEAPIIYVHQVLNHPETPRPVMSLILKHELLHLRPTNAINGAEIRHSVAFWEAERAICPERGEAWAWIYENLWRCIKRRPGDESIDVAANWRSVWSSPKCDLDTCRRNVEFDPAREQSTITW